MNNIIIKKTVKEDSKLFYQLRNDKLNRIFFFNSKKIEFDEHKKWFENNYSKKYYFTCFYNKRKIGYIRGDSLNDTISISITIDKKFRIGHQFSVNYCSANQGGSKFILCRIEIVLDLTFLNLLLKA